MHPTPFRASSFSMFPKLQFSPQECLALGSSAPADDYRAKRIASLLRRFVQLPIVSMLPLLGSALPVSAHETVNYIYDGRGRLVQLSRAGDANNGVITSSRFDAAGNRLNYSVSCFSPAVVSDASFESPAQASGGYTYNPSVAGVTFGGLSGVTANNSAWGFVAAPDGNQVAFIQGASTISITASGLTPGQSYNVSFWAAQRTGQINPFTLSANGTSLGTYTPPSNSFTPFTSASFVASASSQTLAFAGTGGAGGDVSSGIDSILVNRSGNCPTSPAATTADASFEAPLQSTGGYTYNPAVTGMSFAGSSGVTSNNSAWGFLAAPDGNQVAFLQGTSTISMTVSGLTTGASYNVTFWTAQRTGQVNPFTVTMNGASIGTYTPASNTFTPFTTASFVATSPTETLAFAGTGGAGGDVSSGIDSVTIARAP